MAKLGVKSIKGSASPRIGQAVFYEVQDFYPGTPIADHDKVKWNLYAMENGKPRLLDGGPTKTGKKVSYNFPQKWYGESLMIEAYVNTPEKKAPPGLIVRPVKGDKKVTSLAIRDANGNPISKPPKYGEHITAVVTTENMVGDEIDLAIWERDTYFSNTGHDAKANTLLWNKKIPMTAKNGILKQPILLDTGMMAKANKTFDGSEHEYYLVVKSGSKQVVANQTVGVSNSEVVLSPGGKKDPPKPAATPAKPKEDEKGIVDSITEPIIVAAKIGWDMIMDKLNKPATVDVPDEKKPEKSDCPNCDKDITLDDIKKICVSKKNKKGEEKCLIADLTMITAAIPFLNEYRKLAKITTCVKKAHFLAQIAQESKFYDMQEGFTYTKPERMRGIFSSYFSGFGSKENQLKEATRLSNLSLDKKNHPEVANAIYGIKHPNGKNHTDSQDGWRYSGKGFKQITWKDNYVALQKYVKDAFKIDVEWVGGDNPYKLKNNAKDAMLSAIAFWGKNNINSVANENSKKAVEKVTAKINTGLVGLNDRKRFFVKAVKVLDVNKCKQGEEITIEDGTVIIVSGTDKKVEKDPAVADLTWVMYKTSVYTDMKLETYKKLLKANNLPKPDYVTYLSRDTHQVEGTGVTYKHSDKRFGQYNEIPPGEYYLKLAEAGQKYLVYVVDSKSKSASAANGISGVDGDRGGVAIHQYCPRFSVGCFTLNCGKPITKVNAFLDEIPDLNDKTKDVRFIVEERQVSESVWSDKKYGTTKWTGI